MTRVHVGGLITAVALLLLPALPAAADSFPSADCTTTCTTTIDTPTDAGSIAIPVGIANLTVTIAGAQGPNADAGFAALLGGIGGAGGVTTVDLGAGFAGQTLQYGIGDLGQGSYLKADSGELIVIAGGGGQGGYAGRFDLPDQIQHGWPGGAGGAPTSGVADGQPGTSTLNPLNNGLGGTGTGGLGGTGTTNGAAGGDVVVVTPTGAELAAGGAPAVYTPGGDGLSQQRSGAGGSGWTGGGSGAIDLSIEVDEVPVNVAAPGGGGAGWLAPGFTGVAGEGNLGTGWLTLTWTFPPALPATGGAPAHWVPWAAAAMLVLGAGLLAARRRIRDAGADDAG